MPLDAGTRVGPYQVLSKLGEGGMGEVYRARDTRLQRDVAIKVLPRELANDPDFRVRLDREAQLLAALNHPHIAQVYGVEEWNHAPAIVMELVEGDTLQDRIRSGRVLPTALVLTLARQIAAALSAAHDRGVVHRDLKPSNIKVTRHRTPKRPPTRSSPPTWPRWRDRLSALRRT
jgi:serine/threonine protein kinase